MKKFASNLKNLLEGPTLDDEITKWKKISPMVEPRYGSASAILNGILYIVGGVKQDGTLKSEVLRFDCEGMKWLESFPIRTSDVVDAKNPDSYARSFHSLIAYNGKLYMMGGKAMFYHNSLLELDPESSELIWKQVKIEGKKPSKRFGHSLTLIYNTFILFGGYDDLSSSCNDTWIYHFEQNTWEKLACSGSIPPSRYHHVTVYDPLMHCIYIYGGINDANQVLSDMYKLSLHTMTWETVKFRGSTPGGRYGCYGCLRNGSIFIYGGSTKTDSNLFDIFKLNLTSYVWTVVPSRGNAPSGRFYHCGATYGNTVYLFGGQSSRSDKFLGDLYIQSPKITEKKSNTQFSLFERIHLDILLEILSILDAKSLIRIGSTNRNLRTLSMHYALWKNLSLKELSFKTAAEMEKDFLDKESEDWKMYYRLSTFKIYGGTVYNLSENSQYSTYLSGNHIIKYCYGSTDYALTIRGTVLKNSVGVSGMNASAWESVEVEDNLTITDIVANDKCALAITENGELMAYGTWCGANRTRFIKVSCSSKVIKVVMGEIHALVLTAKGEVYGYLCENGYTTNYGQTENLPIQTFDKISSLIPYKIVDIAAGIHHSVVLTNTGKVFTFGSNFGLALGVGTAKGTRQLVEPSLPEKVAAIYSGHSHNFAVTEKGALYSWGNNIRRQIGHPQGNYIEVPTLVKFSDKILKIFCCHETAIILTESWKVWAADGKTGVFSLIPGLEKKQIMSICGALNEGPVVLLSRY